MNHNDIAGRAVADKILEQIGRDVADLVHPSERDRVETLLAALVASGSPSPLLYRVRAADGQWRHLELAASRFRPSDDTEHIVVVGQDVTARIEAETALSEAQAGVVRMQRMDSLGRMAAGMAHDFNNLLTAILGSTAALDEVDDDEVRSAAKEIQEVVNHASGLTRQLLAFGRKSAAEASRFDLAAMTTRFEPILRRLLGASIGLHIHTSEADHHVVGEPSQLEQTLVNLVVNARDAMPDGGRTDITLTRQRVGEDEARRHSFAPGEYVVLEVRDTGTGIDPLHIDHIFEPFFTTKAESHGTGLGLATAYTAARAVGGDIEVESQLGEGTRFRLFLPHANAATA